MIRGACRDDQIISQNEEGRKLKLEQDVKMVFQEAFFITRKEKQGDRKKPQARASMG